LSIAFVPEIFTIKVTRTLLNYKVKV